MFDDPKKDLKWLEQQLLAEEAHREDPPEEEWFGEEEDWLDAELRQAHALLGDTPAPGRNQEDVFAFLQEDPTREDAAAVYADAPAQPSPKKGKKKKEKGVGGLVFLACLETLGIIAVLLWWVIWLL